MHLQEFQQHCVDLGFAYVGLRTDRFFDVVHKRYVKAIRDDQGIMKLDATMAALVASRTAAVVERKLPQREGLTASRMRARMPAARGSVRKLLRTMVREGRATIDDSSGHRLYRKVAE